MELFSIYEKKLMTPGSRIRKAREEKAFTRSALAKLLQIDGSQYGKIENDKLNPTVPQILAICSILEQSLDYILLGKQFENNQILEINDTIETPNYKEAYEMALKNMELQNEIINLKDRINTLEKNQIKSRYDIGGKNEPHSNVAESKSELEH